MSTRADELIEAACARTGETDFGAAGWRDGLDVLVASLDNDAALSPLGQDVLRDQLVGHLANRLEIERWHRDNPDIAQHAITRPLFGLGLPRTGSTALSFLLALDPQRRSLRTWEAGHPCPPPETATEHDDPRIADSQAGIDVIGEMFPDFVGMLPSSATGPQECILLLALEFRSMVFDGMAYIPTYDEWLFAADMEPAYRYHRRVLQLLQWRCPPTSWWLKTPSHMHAIVELDRVYPDARFVMTHRDITKVIPSVAALMHALSSPLTDAPNPVALAQHHIEMWDVALRRLIEFRDAGNEDRFFDITFEEMQHDPIAPVRRLYAWLDEELTPVAEQRMSAWWEENSKDRHGAREVDPDDFGIDLGELQERFRFYNERFVPSA